VLKPALFKSTELYFKEPIHPSSALAKVAAEAMQRRRRVRKKRRPTAKE
jgi:hypothetical protein